MLFKLLSSEQSEQSWLYGFEIRTDGGLRKKLFDLASQAQLCSHARMPRPSRFYMLNLAVWPDTVSIDTLHVIAASGRRQMHVVHVTVIALDSRPLFPCSQWTDARDTWSKQVKTCEQVFQLRLCAAVRFVAMLYPLNKENPERLRDSENSERWIR